MLLSSHLQEHSLDWCSYLALFSGINNSKKVHHTYLKVRELEVHFYSLCQLQMNAPLVSQYYWMKYNCDKVKVCSMSQKKDNKMGVWL